MPPRFTVPALRVEPANQAAPRRDGDYVLYWMIAARRTGWNFGLQRAVEWCRELDKPLLIFEPLRCGYDWASDRFHAFLLDGMAENALRCARAGIRYYPYVEPKSGSGRGLLEALARHACAVVTDDYPCFFLPRMVRSAAERLPVLLEKVDSNGMLPLRASGRWFTTAFSLRAFLQKELPRHWEHLPVPEPLVGLATGEAKVADAILKRWPVANPKSLRQEGTAKLPIDHEVQALSVRGGAAEAERKLRQFVAQRLDRYDEKRNDPQEEATSGLSPYLHFGHVAAAQVWQAIVTHEGWKPPARPRPAGGKRNGWWKMSISAEAFLDQLITWRELGFVFCHYRPDYMEFESLPDWALETLRRHARDRREQTYDLQAFESARTHDPLWNAAQVQLRQEGRIHNYLRMLWGKKILEWSPTPAAALDIMIELNNKYALDGRDPNSYSGIFWCLGRFDRAWGPERPIFGTVRYMSSASTARKMRVRDYVARYAPPRDGSQRTFRLR